MEYAQAAINAAMECRTQVAHMRQQSDEAAKRLEDTFQFVWVVREQIAVARAQIARLDEILSSSQI